MYERKGGARRRFDGSCGTLRRYERKYVTSSLETLCIRAMITDGGMYLCLRFLAWIVCG